MATYVISDLHGQLDIFNKLLERIGFSEEDRLYVIGDAIDRGSDGIEILLKLMDTPNMELILGNHEFMMLNSVSLDGSVDELPGRNHSLWMFSNGGNVTFEAYRKLELQRRQELLDWLLTRHLTELITVNDKTFCLTHSFFKEEYVGMEYRMLDYQTVWDIVWKTPYRYDIYVPLSEYTQKDWEFIIGHVPVQRIMQETTLKEYNQENVTVIDGGCSYKAFEMIGDDECGVICIRLDDRKITTLSFADL